MEAGHPRPAERAKDARSPKWFYGCPPAFHFGVKLEFTNHSTGASSDPIAASMCLKSKCAKSSLGWW
jgi:hypothetical protein